MIQQQQQQQQDNNNNEMINGCAQIVIEKITDQVYTLMIIPSYIVFVVIEIIFIAANLGVCALSNKTIYNVF